MMAVEGGDVLRHVKRDGKLSGSGKCPGNMSRGKCPDR